MGGSVGKWNVTTSLRVVADRFTHLSSRPERWVNLLANESYPKSILHAPAELPTLRKHGTGVRIYDLMGPDCGQVAVRVDDQGPTRCSRFDSYCTYHRLGAVPVATGLPSGSHTISIEIDPEPPDKRTILAQRGNVIDDPQRYDGTAWYAGAILLRGQLLD